MHSTSSACWVALGVEVARPARPAHQRMHLSLRHWPGGADAPTVPHVSPLNPRSCKVGIVLDVVLVTLMAPKAVIGARAPSLAGASGDWLLAAAQACAVARALLQ